MKLRIDPGRIVIPKPVRKRLGLTSGTELDVVERPAGESLPPHFETVPAGKNDYLEALATLEPGGWGGRKIYDAPILNCASKCDADRIYTLNLSDFQMLAPATIRQRICAP